MMRPFEYIEPSTLGEALDLLHQYGDKAKVLAGGTDLIVQMKQGKVHPQAMISLRNLSELNFVEVTSGKSSGLRLGPMTPLSMIATTPLLPEHLTILREAALAIGDVQIRNTATIGGNLANASPSADMVPALLVLGARVRIQKKGAERIIDLENFYSGPFMSRLTSEELIVEISVLPIPEGNGAYLWLPKQTSVDETLVGVGAWLSLDIGKRTCLEASLALNSVSPFPIRARNAETFLQGKELKHDHFQKAGEIAAQEVSPRSRAEYRRKIVSILVEKTLEQAWKRAGECMERKI
jgi:carbon-monoxide dehydrogenase medium subunit